MLDMSNEPDKYSLLTELAEAKDQCNKNIDKLLDARPLPVNASLIEKIDALIMELYVLRHKIEELYDTAEKTT